MSKNTGYVFESELRRGLVKYFPFSFKLPDTRAFGAIIMRATGKDTPLILPKVPCDFIAADHNGKMYMIEAKNTQATALAFDAIKPHQLELLTEAHFKAKVESYFVINFRANLGKRDWRNETYVVHAATILHLKRLFEEKGRKSIPLCWFRDNAMQLVVEYDDRKNRLWKINLLDRVVGENPDEIRATGY